MINSGIVRKIDDLGRIVIPKEIRKTLNIKNGDDFEIIIDNNRILLERYLILESYENRIINIINTFIKETNYKIYVSINDKLINYNNEVISDVLSNIIQSRKVFINNKYEKNIINNNLIIEGKLIVYPIVIDSDLLGSLIIIFNDDVNRVLIISKIIIDLIKNILNRNY